MWKSTKKFSQLVLVLGPYPISDFANTWEEQSAISCSDSCFAINRIIMTSYLSGEIFHVECYLNLMQTLKHNHMVLLTIRSSLRKKRGFPYSMGVNSSKNTARSVFFFQLLYVVLRCKQLYRSNIESKGTVRS